MKQKRRIYQWLLALLSVVCLTGCGSTLTRAKAKALLEKYSDQGFESARFSYGILFISTYRPQDAQYLDLLVNQGLITMQQIEDPNSDYKKYSVQFTPAGRAYIIQDFPSSLGCYAEVKTARKQIIDVVGIRFYADENSAQVDYTWKYVDPTPFAKAIEVQINNPAYSGDQVNTDKTMMTKYDDGWRIGR